MAYENLKDKFLKNEDYLYGKNPLVGNEKNGWYVEYRPNSKKIGEAGNPALDTRAVPIVSTARDTVRITRFLLSGKGLLFLGKQTLLQTGNTFGQTRLLNPLFITKQLIPFGHFPRHASNVPLFGALFGKPPGDEPPGGLSYNRLQKETLSSVRSRVKNTTKIPLKTKFSLSNLLDQIVSPFKAITSSIGGATVGKDQRPEIKFEGGKDYWEIIKQTTMVSVRTKSSDARELTRASAKTAITKIKNTKTFEFTGLLTRPELGVTIPANIAVGLFSPVTVSTVDYVQTQLTNTKNSFQKLLNDQLRYEKTSGISIHTARQSLNSVFPRGTGKKIRHVILSDDINASLFQNNGTKKDYIIFTLQSGGDLVQLRAFLDDFGVNVNGQWNEKRYIGRYEKFVTYTGVDRKIDLSFYLLPQNRSELSVIWEKLDWITRLTYPVDIQTAGHFEPPLTKLTIGNVFNNLVVYVNSVSWKTDKDTIWDIDYEVPQYLRVTMSLTVIESAMNTLQRGALYEIAKSTQGKRVLSFLTPPTVPETATITTIQEQPPLREAPSTFPTVPFPTGGGV